MAQYITFTEELLNKFWDVTGWGEWYFGTMRVLEEECGPDSRILDAFETMWLGFDARTYDPLDYADRLEKSLNLLRGVRQAQSVTSSTGEE